MIIQTRLIYELSRLIEQHSSYVGVRGVFTNIKALRCLPIDRQKNLSHLLKHIIKKIQHKLLQTTYSFKNTNRDY